MLISRPNAPTAFSELPNSRELRGTLGKVIHRHSELPHVASSLFSDARTREYTSYHRFHMLSDPCKPIEFFKHRPQSTARDWLWFPAEFFPAPPMQDLFFRALHLDVRRTKGRSEWLLWFSKKYIRTAFLHSPPKPSPFRSEYTQ